MAVVFGSGSPGRTLLGVSFALFGLTSVSARAADQITFVSQGGAYQKAQTVAILDPAAKKLGITINQDSAPDSWPIMKTQVATGKPTWDVVDVPTGYCLRGGDQGLVEKLDFSKIPNAAAMPEAYRSAYSVAYEFYSSVLAYSQNKYPVNAAPNSWADFWDVRKFPGRRALRNHPIATLEAALMADGVAPDKLYPLDVDRAFKKLEEIKPNITVWWTSGAQSAQLLNDGEVDMVMAWNGRVSALANEGAKVAFTYDHPAEHVALCVEGRAEPADRHQFPQRGCRSRQSGQPAAAHRLRPGEPKSLRYRRDQAGSRRAIAECARERQQAGADVLCMVVVAGWRGRRETLGRLHAEMNTRAPHPRCEALAVKAALHYRPTTGKRH